MMDELLNQRLGVLHDDVSEMKIVLRELAAAVNKLALVEQQQGQLAQALDRAFLEVKELSKRVAEVEKRLPEVTRTSIWVDRAVWSAAGVAIMLALKKIGLL